MATAHINANLGDIAPLVVMSGDPLRAKYIAEKYLSNAKQVNGVRNMFAYTGEYKGKQITVMGHGMGMGSACIYFYELFNIFKVNKIIRVGSCGALKEGLELFDTIIVNNAMTDSNIGKLLGINKTKLPSDQQLLINAIKVSGIENDKTVKVGDIYTSDLYYTPDNKANAKFKKKGAYGVEMESYGLFATALMAKKQALAIMTVSNIIGDPKETTPEERERGFNKMIEIALDSIIL